MIRSAPPEYQSELAKVLFDLSAVLPRETAGDVDRLIIEVLPADSPLSLAVRVRQALLDKNIDEAERLVSAMPDQDDAIALQFRSQILLERGQKHDARLAIERACARFRTPGLLELAANLAVEEQDWNAAADAFQRVLHILPSDGRVRNNRAYTLIQAQRFAEAAEEFKELARLEPKNSRHRINRAAAFAQGGRLEESLAAFQDYCVAAGFPPDGIMGQCEILVSLDRAAEAFALANEYIDRYWDKRKFVAGFMSCAYAAGQDQEAHRAMMRLQELEQAVEPGRRILHAVSLDELKEHFTSFRKSEDMLHEQLLRGQIPWLFADRLLNRVPYSSWSLRTQTLKWESDDPLGAARFSIYATNGFQSTDTDANKELRELLCSDANQPVCIDISSLLTLNELGLLAVAADYFGKLLVPAQCCESTLDHLRSLVPHQPSRRDAAIAIRSAIEAGRIAVPDSASTETAMPRLSEIDDSDRHAYRFIDLAAALSDAGVIGTTEYSSLRNIAHRPSGVNADHPPLVGGQQLLCDASTLESLAQQGLLGVCLAIFDISLSPDDRREVFGAIQSFDAQAQIHERASQLYQFLRSNSRIVFEHVAIPPEFAEGSLFDDPLAGSTFAAAFCSIEKNLPLFADDRALQMYVCHRRPGAAASAFATPAFIEALAANDNADMAILAPALLSLINWRYRFIVPSVRFLKYYADQFPQHIPGRHLRQVASYAHHSMNDPGLFCGIEPTNPPTTIGTRLYFLWIKAFMELAASCWLDETCAVERASAVTQWILMEAIPPIPRMLNPHAQGILATQTRLTLLNYLALATATTTKSERIAGAMKSFRDTLEFSDSEYLHLVTQIAHER